MGHSKYTRHTPETHTQRIHGTQQVCEYLAQSKAQHPEPQNRPRERVAAAATTASMPVVTAVATAQLAAEARPPATPERHPESLNTVCSGRGHTKMVVGAKNEVLTAAAAGG